MFFEVTEMRKLCERNIEGTEGREIEERVRLRYEILTGIFHLLGLTPCLTQSV